MLITTTQCSLQFQKICPHSISSLKKDNSSAKHIYRVSSVSMGLFFQKNIYFCFIDYAKAFDCVDHNKLENSERDRNTSLLDLPLEKPICRSRSNS